MPLPYEIRVNITRERARDLIIRLAEDPEFRRRFETDTRAMLADYQIEVGPETLPEPVRLPDPDAIRDFLALLETRIAPETASPFGVAVVILAFGAMPVLAGDRPALDGTG
jgi:hypothetical protein